MYSQIESKYYSIIVRFDYKKKKLSLFSFFKVSYEYNCVRFREWLDQYQRKNS